MVVLLLLLVLVLVVQLMLIVMVDSQENQIPGGRVGKADLPPRTVLDSELCPKAWSPVLPSWWSNSRIVPKTRLSPGLSMIYMNLLRVLPWQ